MAALILGCARFSMSRWSRGEATSIATIHAALDAGVRHLDTADSYHDPGAAVHENERLVAKALATWRGGDRDGVLVATKAGRAHAADGSWTRDASPDALRKACDGSLTALGVERIGLYHLHGIDDAVPLEESLGALVDLRTAGKIDRIGVSNLDAGLLAVAIAVVGDVAALQDPLSPARPEHLELAVSCPVPFHAWAPLEGVRTDDEARALPAFTDTARRLGLTVRQLTLVWLRGLGRDVTPIIGPVDPTELAECLAAPDTVDPDELRALPSVRARHRACAVVLRDDAILMVEQSVGGRVWWTLPGGGIEPGETPLDAARRELWEEARLEATSLRWLCDAPCAIHLAEVPPDQEPSLDPARPDADELTGVAWRPLAEVADDRQVSVVLAALAALALSEADGPGGSAGGSASGAS